MSADDAAAASASTELPPIEAVVRRTDLSLAYRLDGVTVESRFVGLDALSPWQLETDVVDGDRVERGDLVGRRAVRDALRTALEGGSNGIDRGRLDALLTQEDDVRAPTAGVFTATVDGPGILAAGLDVAVPLSPLQELRYRSVRFSGRAEVETVLGPRTVDCVALWRTIGDGDGEGDGDGKPVSAAVEDAPGRELRCRLPSVAETAPGLRAQLLLETEPILDVLVVPNAFLGYEEDDDTYVVTVEVDGRATTVPVTAGVTDGVVRVIDGDVAEGARLLPISR